MKKILTLLFVLSLALPANAADKTPIKIALVGPITGPAASIGETLQQGAKLAVEDINAKGGVLGRQLQLEIFDDMCDPKQAVSIANKVIASDIKFVNGHACSGATMAAADVYTDSDVIMMTATASNPQITQKPRWNIFRFWPRDDEEVKVIATYLNKKYPGGKIALVDDKQSYSTSVASLLEKELKKTDLKIIMREKITAGEKDYSALANKIMTTKPDLFFYSGFGPEAGLIARQLGERGSTIPLVSTTALLTPDFLSVAGKYGERAVFAAPANPSHQAQNKNIVAQMRAKKIPEDVVVFYSYGTIQTLADAMSKAGTTDTKKVASVLRERKFVTVVGDAGFNANGDFVSAPFKVHQWQNGEMVELKE